MILSIALKEFYTNLVSARFTIGFLLCLVLIPFTMLVSINDYKTHQKAYEIEKKQADKNNVVKVYSALRPEIVKPPEKLSIFSRGISNNVGNKVKIYFGIKPMLAEGRNTIRANPLLNGYFSLDFVTVTAIILSLLALLFTYDSCTREREQGTLKLILASSLSRWELLLGKILGAAMTILPVILFCYLLSALIILFHPAVSFTAGEWLRIAVMILTSIICFTFFMFLGVFISSRLRSSMTSIVVCLFIWVTTLFVIPNMAVYAGQSFVERDTQENLDFALNDLDKEFREKVTDYRMKMENADWHMNWNMSGGADGYMLVGGSSKSLYEFYRTLNMFQEPLRLEYADKKWSLQKVYIDKLDRQRICAERLALISPSEIFRQTASSLCRTDVESQYKFLERAIEYREELISYFNDKKLFESFAYFTTEDPKTFKTADEIIRIRTGGQFQTLSEFGEWSRTHNNDWSPLYKVDIPGTNPWEAEPLNISHVPQFRFKPAELFDNLKQSLGKLVVLILGCIIMFFLSFISFTRYDVR
ncbi:MAG: ABC transporter permease subunit [Candidatus Latescibacteria bacterium]|nr:ABC transporter permease subunit [Candidatus Latescibacterota bacterium]